MKAVICPKYGPPEVLQLTEIEKPVPKDNEILVRIKTTTVTVADIRIRSFTVPPAAWLPARLFLGITKPRKPVLGVELAGDVESVGKMVTRFKPGDSVVSVTLNRFGAYAEYTCLPEKLPISIMPESISYEEAAAIPVGTRTALHYLKRANIKEGQKILIYGASGSVGTYAVQLANYFGAEITGVCSTSNFDLVKSLGADKVIDYNDPDFVAKLEKYDIILLAIDKLPFSICNKALEENGIYLNVTNPLKSLSQLCTSITSKKKIIMGENPPDSSEDLTYLIELTEKGILKPVIDKVYTMDQIVEAHRYVDKGHKKGNVVVKIAD